MLHLSLRVPLPSPINTLNIKTPEQSPKNQPHLHIAQMPSDTSSRSKGERLSGLLVISIVRLIQPALRDEAIAVAEVVGRVTGRPASDGDGSASRNPVPVDGVATLGHSSEQTCGNWRVDSQAFFEAGVQVGEFAEVFVGDVFFGLEGCADLVAELFVLVCVVEEASEEAAESVGCRLGACHYEESAVDDDFVLFEVVLLALFEDVPYL